MQMDFTLKTKPFTFKFLFWSLLPVRERPAFLDIMCLDRSKSLLFIPNCNTVLAPWPTRNRWIPPHSHHHSAGHHRPCGRRWNWDGWLRLQDGQWCRCTSGWQGMCSGSQVTAPCLLRRSVTPHMLQRGKKVNTCMSWLTRVCRRMVITSFNDCSVSWVQGLGWFKSSIQILFLLFSSYC